MNTIKCASCKFENTLDLVFCTNCGTRLSGPERDQRSTPTVPRIAAQVPPTLPIPANKFTPAKNNSIRYLIAAGLIGILLLFAGAVVLSGFFYYLGSRTGRTDTNISNSNRVVSNRNTKGSNTSANKPIDPDIDDTDLTENPFTLPPAVGPYEQQAVLTGNPADDFLGADEVTKTTYTKGGKQVEFILAKFSNRDAAKKGYDDFMKGFRESGAKVLGKQKVKNKSGVNNGEVSLFTFSKKWNALIYSEKLGVRFTAPDRYTLIEFAKEFDKVFSAK